MILNNSKTCSSVQKHQKDKTKQKNKIRHHIRSTPVHKANNQKQNRWRWEIFYTE